MAAAEKPETGANPNELGDALQKARSSRGFTQADIASELGLSRATVAQIETGRRSLKAEELRQLAVVYGCSPSELLTPTGDNQEEDAVAELFRAHPGIAKHQGAGSFSGVCETARSLTELTAMLGINAIAHALPSYLVEHVSTPWQAARQGYRVAEDERRRLALGEGPIRFVDELLMTLGVDSAKISLPTGITSLSIAQSGLGRLVVVDKNLSLGHRRFSYAHGLAHLLFDTEGPWTVCTADVDPALAEVRADAFASGLLIPEHGLRRYMETLGKETLGRTGPAVLSVFSEGDGQDTVGTSRRVVGRKREGRYPITLSDILRTAYYYGTSPSVAAHRSRNLQLLTDRELDRLESRLRSVEHDPFVGESSRSKAPDHIDILCSRLAVLAASALHWGNIDADRFNKLVDIAGVRAADREHLLATTAVSQQQMASASVLAKHSTRSPYRKKNNNEA